jgi:hypothetical protein
VAGRGVESPLHAAPVPHLRHAAAGRHLRRSRPAPAPAVRIFPLAAQCGVPASAAAVVSNLTVTQPAAPGSLSILPGDGPNGNTIVLAFRAGQTRANNAILKLSVDGQASIAVRNGAAGTVQLILDVSGYLAP